MQVGTAVHSSKPRTFQYRYVEGLNNGNTLQQILKPVLFETHKTVGARAEPVGNDDDQEEVRRCINHKISSRNMLFGELILYVRGTNKQVVTVDEDQEELPVEQIHAPRSDGGAPREFVEGTVYFGLINNHMVIVQSLALRDRDLENHLRWLLHDRAEKLADNEFLALRKELSVDAKQELPNVRSIKVGAPLFYRGHGPNDDKGHVVAYISELGKDLLDALIGNDQLKDLQLERYCDAENLEVTLEIRRKGGRRGEGGNGERAIAALTTHLRHSHEEDITVITKSGRVIGEKLYLAERRSVECHDGVPLRHSLFENMYEWLATKLEEGALQP